MIVWPFLISLALVCSFKNWRAGAAFILCILCVRLFLYLELKDPLVWRMVLYSVTSFVVLFFVDRVAGGFFAIVGVSMIGAMLGLWSVRGHVIFSEVTLAAGMIASAISGPSGGLYHPISASGFGGSGHLVTSRAEASSSQD